MTKEYVKYSGAEVELASIDGDTLLIDKTSSVEIKGSNVYVTVATVNKYTEKLIQGKSFFMRIISPITDVDTHEDSKLLQINYSSATLCNIDVKFEHNYSDGFTYKFDVGLSKPVISIVKNKQNELDLLVNKLIKHDKKIEQLSNEMEEFRKLVLEKLDKLDKKDVTVDLNRYTWESLSDSMVCGTLDKEYDIAKGCVTGGNIESEKLYTAKDLVNKLSDELRTKGMW